MGSKNNATPSVRCHSAYHPSYQWGVRLRQIWWRRGQGSSNKKKLLPTVPWEGYVSSPRRPFLVGER